MQKLEIIGTNKLKGKIDISGSKNASLPILAASLLSNKKVFLKNLIIWLGIIGIVIIFANFLR